MFIDKIECLVLLVSILLQCLSVSLWTNISSLSYLTGFCWSESSIFESVSFDVSWYKSIPSNKWSLTENVRVVFSNSDVFTTEFCFLLSFVLFFYLFLDLVFLFFDNLFNKLSHFSSVIFSTSDNLFKLLESSLIIKLDF